MATGVSEFGTQSATTVHDLGSGSTVNGLYTCNWNLDAMVNGNLIRCYVKAKVLTGDTAAVVYEGWYQHADGGGEPIVSSPPVVSPFFIQCGVEEVGANTISIPWNLFRHAEY